VISILYSLESYDIWNWMLNLATANKRISTTSSNDDERHYWWLNDIVMIGFVSFIILIFGGVTQRTFPIPYTMNEIPQNKQIAFYMVLLGYHIIINMCYTKEFEEKVKFNLNKFHMEKDNDRTSTWVIFAFYIFFFSNIAYNTWRVSSEFLGVYLILLLGIPIIILLLEVKRRTHRHESKSEFIVRNWFFGAFLATFSMLDNYPCLLLQAYGIALFVHDIAKHGCATLFAPVIREKGNIKKTQKNGNLLENVSEVASDASSLISNVY